MIIENDSTISEIDKYLNDSLIGIKSDPLKFWQDKSKQFPTLSRMAHLYLAFPLESIDVERLASVEGNIVSVKRSSLNVDTIEMLAIGRYNLGKYDKNLK